MFSTEVRCPSLFPLMSSMQRNAPILSPYWSVWDRPTPPCLFPPGPGGRCVYLYAGETVNSTQVSLHLNAVNRCPFFLKPAPACPPCSSEPEFCSRSGPGPRGAGGEPGTMDHTCVDLLKRLICLLILLCWVCSAFVVGLGEFQMMNSRFGSLVPGFWPIYPANTLVVTGTIACCVSYVGLLGSAKENRCMLIMFFILLFTLMLVELAMGAVFLVFQTKVDSYLERDMLGGLQAVRTAQRDANQTLRNDFDAIQYLFKCCGVHGEADWEGNTPASCCRQDECDSAPYDSWPEGCLLKLRDWFSHNFRCTGAGVVTLVIIQMACMSVTVPLFCHLKRNRLGFH